MKLFGRHNDSPQGGEGGHEGEPTPAAQPAESAVGPAVQSEGSPVAMSTDVQPAPEVNTFGFTQHAPEAPAASTEPEAATQPEAAHTEPAAEDWRAQGDQLLSTVEGKGELTIKMNEIAPMIHAWKELQLAMAEFQKAARPLERAVQTGSSPSDSMTVSLDGHAPATHEEGAYEHPTIPTVTDHVPGSPSSGGSEGPTGTGGSTGMGGPTGTPGV